MMAFLATPAAAMPSLKLLVLLLVFGISGCTGIQRTAHMYGSEALPAQSFEYRDGGSGTYYSFATGDTSQTDTVLFFYGATGCPSWKSVMPGYVSGLTLNARVFALNKRFVSDRSTGLFDCGPDFHRANNPDQWVADYLEFINWQTEAIRPKPKNVVLVGVSEGAIPAARIAVLSPAITHLAIIGSGGYPMRKSLATLRQKGAISFDAESGWKKIAADPRSIEKEWFGNRYRWWYDIMDIDPLADLLKLNIPILLGMGGEDQSVPVESAYFLKEKFEEAGKDNLVVRIYPGADHRLMGNALSYRSDFFAELGRFLRETNPPALQKGASPQSSSHAKP
jgi:pimeloyl-ACP methyl ester carboxylesterase